MKDSTMLINDYAYLIGKTPHLVDLEDEVYRDTINGADNLKYSVFYHVKNWFPN